MTVRSRMVHSARLGILALAMGMALVGPAAAAHADPLSLPDVLTVVLPSPAPGEGGVTPPGGEIPPPVEETPPPVEETAPPVEETPPPVEETAPPVQETPPPVEETAPPVPSTPPQSPVAVVPPVVTPQPKPTLPQLVAPAAPSVGVDEAAAEPAPTPEPVPTLEPAKAPAVMAAVAPPAMMKSEIQAAVAVATGSPLVVQLITVMILLAAGLLYFRFLAGKSPSIAAKASK